MEFQISTFQMRYRLTSQLSEFIEGQFYVNKAEIRSKKLGFSG